MSKIKTWSVFIIVSMIMIGAVVQSTTVLKYTMDGCETY
jgi:hypothetical protein